MLPSLLTSRLKTITGDHYDEVIAAFAKNRKWSLRINTLKSDGTDVIQEFSEKGIILEEFTGFEWVYMFDREHEYAIKGSTSFYEGKIYLQSIASMLPVFVLEPESDEIILDVCAAPGSKTTQIAMMMENTGKIFAIEQNQIRFDKLMHNCKLQWASIIEWVKMDARHFLSDTGGAVVVSHIDSDICFDRILLDAPCSAEGRIFLDNEKTYGFWSLDNIVKKAALQLELLLQAFEKLEEGGVLVYSTCTLAPEENEWVITELLKTHTNAILEPIDIGLGDKSWWTPGLVSFGRNTVYSPELLKTVRILPSDETEGFYIAKIRKI
jgi:NOL1/NOP2/sun family putative RNA methylase